ncbi:MAG: ROK family transcriptional regulator [Candidatus Atribacteria bacterium]|nr:ROK family transcriptional regulator [Candidatus Atribacteria bacterium]
MKHRDMKFLNRGKILGFLLNHSLLSRADLAEKADVSPAVVSHIIRECLKEGIIREDSEGVSRGGRKPILLSFVPDNKLVAGLVPGNITKFAVSNLSGQLLYKEEIITKKYPTPIELAGFLKKILNEFLIRNHKSWSQLVSLGIGIPGIYDPELDLIHKMGKISSLFEWEGAKIREIFSREFPCPVLVFDKVVAMAFGEGILSSDVPNVSLVYLHLGRGVGAGLFLNGKIYRGSQGAAGEVGYMVCKPVDEIGPISLHDIPPLESEISLNTILKDFREKCPNSFAGNQRQSENDEIMILRKTFLKGDPQCETILKPVLEKAEGIAVNLVAMLNPDFLVLGGKVTEIFSEILQERIVQRLQRSVLFLPRVKTVTLGKNEEIMCTLFFSIDDYFQRLTGNNQGLTSAFLKRYNPRIWNQ